MAQLEPEKIVIKITADTTEFERGMAQVSSRLRSLHWWNLMPRHIQVLLVGSIIANFIFTAVALVEMFCRVWK